MSSLTANQSGYECDRLFAEIDALVSYGSVDAGKIDKG